MDRGGSSKELPAPHDDIDISGVEFETVADAAAHFGRDQARARAEKWVIDRLAGAAVVDDRAAHALDRLLGAVPPALLALLVAKRIVVGDFPDCRLRSVASPMAGFTLSHRVPAGFVLPVIIAAAEGEVLLCPDDLSAKPEPAGGKGGDYMGVQCAVPGIGDTPGEERIRLAPVGAVVVEHLAPREIARALAPARSPGWVVADAIRRIGD